MSWLKSIYESIVNEIGADDAYNRFYSSIPRKDYDEILAGNPAPDKFMQFILNCVRDGKSTKEDAVEAVTAYNNADTLVKQNVLNKFRSGEYSDVLDVAADIKYLSSGGAILSRKKFAKEGLIKLKENERWIATCTTNYVASNHYFGDSHWCTASDREGRYDGYRMFRNYTDGTSVLIQFKWKGRVLPKPDEGEDQPESLDYVDRTQYDPKLGCVSDAIAKDDSMYQVQIDDEGYIGQICDWDDNSSSEETLRKVIGEEMYSVLLDKELIRWLLKKTNDVAEKEEKYQDGITELINKKRKRREESFKKVKAQIEDECEEFNKQKTAVVEEKWKEFVDNKMYRDPNIMSYLYKRDAMSTYRDDLDVKEEEEKLIKTNYVTVQEMEYSEECGFCVLKLSPILGLSYYPNTSYRDYRCEKEEMISTSPVGGELVVICHDEGRSIDHVIGPYGGNFYMSIRQISDAAGEMNERFIEIHVEEDNDINEFGLIFDAKLNKAITYRGMKFGRVSTLGKDECIFVRSGMRSCYIIYNPITGERKDWKSGDPGVYLFMYGNAISICDYDNNGGQVVYSHYYNISGLHIPDSRELQDIEPEGEIVGLRFKNGETNAIIIGEKEMLFGRDGTDVFVSPKKCSIKCRIKDTDGRLKRFSITYENGEYYKVDENTESNPVKCNKYGETEQEQIGRKNFDAWVKNGGHSTEAKAQMDKMWADRRKQNSEFSGDAAMKAWNDNDRMLDKKQGEDEDNPKYDPNFGFQNALQSFDADDRWRGYMGLKDPEGFSKSINRTFTDSDVQLTDMINGKVPDYVRRNPWYRIGKDGKPIDQPWYDEDEIPARLSDRVANEQKVNESYNKMKSIWDRMGLND